MNYKYAGSVMRVLTLDGKACCFNKLLFLFIVLSGFHKTGLSLDRDHPFGVGTAIPYLEPIKYNTTVFRGQTAYLPCVTRGVHLQNFVVSWIRKKDLHILTSGSQVYTNDKRVSIVREGKLLNAWTLKIASVEKKDEGFYECQINTEPKMTVMMHLGVLLGTTDDESGGALALGMLDSPYHQKDDNRAGYQAKILPPSLMELEQGQLANFTCIISHGGPPPNITWFFNEIPIQRARGGFSVNTEKSAFSTNSQLVIHRVDKRRDEGKYSCGGATIYPDSVILKVRQGYDPHSTDAWPNRSSSNRIVIDVQLYMISIFVLLRGI